MAEQIVQVTPDEVQVGSNIRLNLKKIGIDSLMENILEVGGVHTPIVVDAKVNGKYPLVFGARRVAAVDRLNKEQSAGLTLPAIVRPTAGELDRLKHQLSENLQRESLSPMDMATAIDQLIKAGVSKGDIRKVFSSPRGAKLKNEPASNAKINMIHSFLTLPKPVQAKVHEGLIGVATAYELTKVDKDKQEAVLTAAEEERLKQMKREDAEEDRFLGAEKKAADLSAKAQAEQLLKEAVALDVEELKGQFTEKQKALGEAFMATTEAEDKKAAAEHYKAAEADFKGIEAALKKKTIELKKLSGEHKKSEGTAEKLRERITAAKMAKGAKSAKEGKVQPEDVKTALRVVTGDAKPIALKLVDIKALVKELASPGSFVTVQKIGKLLESAFDGILTTKELAKQIAYLVGDAKAPVVPKAK